MRKPSPSRPIPPEVQRRLDVLERLIDTEYGRSPALFEQKTGIKMVQVGQWFSGYRRMRENAVRRLEEATGKPPGYFDGPLPALPGQALWPFATIPIERFLALPEKQQGWVEAKLDGLIESCEAQKVKSDEEILRRYTTREEAKSDKDSAD